MQTKQLWLEIKGIVHLIFIVCVYPPFFLPCGVPCTFGSGLLMKIWLLGELSFYDQVREHLKILHPSTFTHHFCLFLSRISPLRLCTDFVSYFVCFYNYSNGTKKRGLRTALFRSALTSSVLKSESIKLDAAIIVFLKKKNCLHLN